MWEVFQFSLMTQLLEWMMAINLELPVPKRRVEMNLLRVNLGLNLQMREGREKEQQEVTDSLVAWPTGGS